jgi:GNAT superfamily N-acetyltransferase
VQVRRLAPADGETLRTIRLEALRSDPDAFGSTLEREESRSDDDWRAWLGRGATFVAETDDGPVGLIVAIPHDDPTTVGIYAMFVSSRARRGGVGRALVEAAIEWATGRDAERVTLMVIDGNEPASKLYESCGFTYSGESERRERDGAVELAMSRVIRTAR